MWNHKTLEEFRGCIKDLLAQPDVLSMNKIPQHVKNVTCLDHCIFVSYLSFSICRRLRLNAAAAARAGLLHDLYLCNWENASVGRWRRLLIHPQMALQNAEAHGLSDLERDIIAKHMWPVTLRKIPRHRESFIVNGVDTLCALAEMLHLYRPLGAGRWLFPLNPHKYAPSLL